DGIVHGDRYRGLRREVGDAVDAAVAEQHAVERRRQVARHGAVDEGEVRVALPLCDVGSTSGGEIVQDGDAMAPLHQQVDGMAADETRAARHEHVRGLGHGVRVPLASVADAGSDVRGTMRPSLVSPKRCPRHSKLRRVMATHHEARASRSRNGSSQSARTPSRSSRYLVEIQAAVPSRIARAPSSTLQPSGSKPRTTAKPRANGTARTRRVSTKPSGCAVQVFWSQYT